MIEPKPIASLEPGKRYVIKAPRFRSAEEFERFQQHLQEQAPECRFLILQSPIELVGEAHHCKDCKHYRPPLHESKELGVCALTVTSYAQLDHRGSIAYALDAQPRHYAELRVEPDFGCIQFEAKEPQ
jgi:hypothetical protein